MIAGVGRIGGLPKVVVRVSCRQNWALEVVLVGDGCWSWSLEAVVDEWNHWKEEELVILTTEL